MCRASGASTAAWPRSGSRTSIWGGWASSWPPSTRGDRGGGGVFRAAFRARLERGAVVRMFDERDVPDRRAPASRVDAAGNRYERRRLAAGGAVANGAELLRGGRPWPRVTAAR